VTPYPLGRLKVHDERSRAFALAPVALPTKTVLHNRRLPIFDQGSLGSCTANAALGMLCTGPLDIGKSWTEKDAVDFYSAETVVDDSMGIPGRYPPTDTGSCGLASMKVAQQRGWITSYRHAFSVTTLLGWLGRQPASIGIPWLESMFAPAPGTAVLRVDRRSAVAGGHQVCVDGIDPKRSMVRIANSWGDWGDGGRAWLRYDDLAWLLKQGGDAVTATL
jgi:hypothetical protein